MEKSTGMRPEWGAWRWFATMLLAHTLRAHEGVVDDEEARRIKVWEWRERLNQRRGMEDLAPERVPHIQVVKPAMEAVLHSEKVHVSYIVTNFPRCADCSRMGMRRDGS